MTKDALHEFIEAARKKKLSDQEIVHLLTQEGWDEVTARAAVSGLVVPAPPDHHDNGQKHTGAGLSALEAALHHILLWIFSLSATIVIAALTASLFGDSPDSDAFSTYLAVIGVTFTAYAVFYGHYLRLLRKNALLITSRVWSIITIVLHSIGLISSLIAITTILIDGAGSDDKAELIAAVSIGVINALIAAAYALANFSTNARMRLRLLPGYIIFVATVLIVFGIFAGFRLEPVRHDNDAEAALLRTTEEVKNYVNDNQKLPDSISDVHGTHDDVQYHRIDDITYEVCADFRLASGDADNKYTQPDDYVDAYVFETHKEGIDCFSFESATLQSTQDHDKPQEESFE